MSKHSATCVVRERGNVRVSFCIETIGASRLSRDRGGDARARHRPFVPTAGGGVKDAGNGSPSRARNARGRLHATSPRRTTRGFRMRTARPMLNPRTHLAGDVHRPRVAHLGRLPAPAREASFSSCLPGVKRPSNAANRPRATLPPRVSHLNRARTPLTRVALGADPSVTPPGGSSASQMRSSRLTRAGHSSSRRRNRSRNSRRDRNRSRNRRRDRRRNRRRSRSRRRNRSRNVRLVPRCVGLKKNAKKLELIRIIDIDTLPRRIATPVVLLKRSLQRKKDDFQSLQLMN